ncbi:MAG: hypothetical protein NWE76_06050 [Candidatus Bathyarchaeota archaeon]|nr:hypothetical protein [Candidatus Bathyarchaeota archaeon]
MQSPSDKIRLEPLAKKKRSGTPSMPTGLGGKIGIWRMIRGNRMFLELTGSAFEGLTAEDVKSMESSEKRERFGEFFDERGVLLPNQDQIEQGRILEGPADLIGLEIQSVPSEVWTRLTPIQTKKEFSKVKRSRNGISALKSSIVDAIDDPSDTRVKRVKSARRVEELVPIARVSGFTTNEIKKIIESGKPSKNTIGAEQEERKNGDKPDLPMAKSDHEPLGRLRTNAASDDQDLIKAAICDIRQGKDLLELLSKLEAELADVNLQQEVYKIRESATESSPTSADLSLLSLLRVLLSPV